MKLLFFHTLTSQYSGNPCRQKTRGVYKMWYKGKLLLAVAIITALFNKGAANMAKPLDMAPNAVDDRYIGCSDQAIEKFIHSGLLKQELNDNAEFKAAWTSQTHCSTVMPGKLKEHSTALAVFNEENQKFLKTFNNAVETMGVNVSTYEDQFHFKSFHFLLMDSMAELPPHQCKTVYAIADEKYTVKKGSTVRFGRFTQVFSILKDMPDLDEEVLLNITSCFFANVGNKVCNNVDSILLSPAEVFTVEDNRKTTNKDDAEYTMIVLKHLKVYSEHNCFIFSRAPADVFTQWPVLVLAALSLPFFHLRWL